MWRTIFMDKFAESRTPRVHLWLKRMVKVEAQEIRPLLWPFSYFFSLLYGSWSFSHRFHRSTGGRGVGVDLLPARQNAGRTSKS
jgi:hypothetical protein